MIFYSLLSTMNSNTERLWHGDIAYHVVEARAARALNSKQRLAILVAERKLYVYFAIPCIPITEGVMTSFGMFNSYILFMYQTNNALQDGLTKTQARSLDFIPDIFESFYPLFENRSILSRPLLHCQGSTLLWDATYIDCQETITMCFCAFGTSEDYHYFTI